MTMRYIIGIDLGTTNSCVCYVDTQDGKSALQVFRIPQVHQHGHVEALATLPSFCYLDGGHRLPWKEPSGYVVGAFAREEGARTPTKLICSAKSWLCHSAADRRSRLLPFEAADESLRISPVEASARYLMHIKEAWNHAKGKGDDSRFEEQDIVLTAPASFDEAARTLTVEAARMAGIRQLTLLEEPQAAFYSWLAQNEAQWDKILGEGDTVLVCDVGGGTTDFSLIDVRRQNGTLTLQRMAVGDHLLLGGDNMDMAIARLAEGKIFGPSEHELPITQWLQLKHQSRKAKEALLSGDPSYRFILQGGGSSVVGGTLSAEVDRGEVEALLLSGFFPRMEWVKARQLKRMGGVKAMGLPYEAEPAITKHLAAFLDKAGVSLKAPDFILFNGGTMKPAAFQEAMIASLAGWFEGKRPQVLASYDLDLAVGRGAAYYGKVRRGLGVKIGGGSARGYYLEVDIRNDQGAGSKKALALLPRGSEEGDVYEPPMTFHLRPNVPVSFTLYTSHVRLHDDPGSLIDIDLAELQPLPPIHTVLRFGKGSHVEQSVPVKLGISLTPLGTIDLWLQAENTPHRWGLEFQLRTVEGNAQTDGRTSSDETFDAAYLDSAREALQDAFLGKIKMDSLMEKLEDLLDRPRKEWPPSVLRGLWETVWKEASQRKLTQEMMARWWNLAGFLLRPGFGHPLDDFRLKELWKIILADQKNQRNYDGDIQRWICLRRVAGGLNRGQQGQLAAELWPLLIDKPTGKIVVKGRGDLYPYTERLRAAASLELVEIPLKVKLGNAILARMAKEGATPVELWAVGRLGARHLFHGSAANVVSRDVATEWLEKLLALGERGDQWEFAVGIIARKSDQRELNIPGEFVRRIVEACGEGEARKRMKTLLTEGVPLTQNEQNKVFGEQLPAGLVLQL